MTTQEMFFKYEKRIKELYLEKNLTAKETCRCLIGTEKIPEGFAQKLHREFPKGLGLGGSRVGSGNKKGVKLKQTKN